MIYLFDKQQNIIGTLANDVLTAGEIDFKINTALSLSITVPISKGFNADVKYVSIQHPKDDSKHLFFRLMSRTDNVDSIEYTATELAYQELSSKSYIQDKRPASSNATTLMTMALVGSGWTLGNVNVTGSVDTNFYYVTNLEAIQNVVSLMGGEVYFYVTISGNKITGRYMDYVAQQGEDTSKVFAQGSNLLTVTKKNQTDSIYTSILPRGKGEQVSEGTDGSPDGYGRRINIEDIVWSKANGDPLDKPKGDLELKDPNANVEWGHIDGSYRIYLNTYDEIEDPNILIQQAYQTLMSVNHPQIEYSATVADVGNLSLGDTVIIMHSERDMSYKTRVFEVKYNLVEPEQTEISLGDDLSSNSITSQINSISSQVSTNSNQTQWNISNGGHNNTSYGSEQPTNPRQGDVWFKTLPNGNTEEWYYNGTIWVLGSTTDQQWKQNQAIQQGSNTVFYGTDTPTGAVVGDTWFKNDNNEPDGKAMYTYSGTTWVKFEGGTDASRLQVGTIDASKINVLNLSADNIVTGNLSANFIKGGQLDFSQINGININASNISSGKINAIDITGSNITGSLITGSTFRTQSVTNTNTYIELMQGLFTVNSGGNIYGEIAPSTGDGGSDSGMYFLQMPGRALSFNSSYGNGTSQAAFRIPPTSTGDNPLFEINGRINSSIRSNNNVMWIEAKQQLILSGNDGSSNALNVYGNHVDVLGNFTVYNGSKNAAHVTRDGVRATPAYETAESYLGDIGESQTDDSKTVKIDIETLFNDIVNTTIDYQVFITPYSSGNIWVSDRQDGYFTVESDVANAKFGWEIKAKRRGYENQRLVLQEMDNETIDKVFSQDNPEGVNNGTE